jgi:hypothetical protein
MKALNIKNIIFLFLVFFLTKEGNGQVNNTSDNYVKLVDISGAFFPENDLTELKNAANDLVNAFPQEFQSQFKVYDMGFYRHTNSMVGTSTSDVWSSTITGLSAPYYLIFGRESDPNGNFNQIRVELKLPNRGGLECIDNTYLEIIKNSVRLPTEVLLKNGIVNGNISAHIEAERISINNLKSYLTKVVNCCNNGSWNPSCGTCRYDFNEIMAMLRSRKYLRLETSDIIITDYAYSGIQSTKKVVCNIQGVPVNFTDHLEELANQNSGATKIVVREINNLNCSTAENFQEIVHDNAYNEDVIILNFDGNKEIFTKFSADQNSRLILPWLASEAIKRIAMAAAGGIFEVGVTLLLEYYFEEHTSYNSAWQAAKIDWIEVAGSAAEGAFSEAKYASIIIGAMKPIVQWIINTPYSAYAKGEFEDSREGPGWVIKFTSKVVEELASSAIEEIALKKVDKLLTAMRNSPRGKRISAVLIYKVTDLIKKRPKLIFKWKKLGAIAPSFSSNSDLLDDPNFMEKIMDAVDPDIHQLTLQKGLGKLKGESKTLGDNLKLLGKGPKPGCLNCQAHHIIPGAETSPAAIALRAKLKNLGIDLNEATNGVYLPQQFHATTFYEDYERAVRTRLNSLSTANAVRAEMNRISLELQAGKIFW